MNGKRKYLPRPSGTAPLAKILKEKEKQLQLQQRWSTCRMSWPWMLEGASLRCCCRPGRAKGQRRAGLSWPPPEADQDLRSREQVWS
ncbi:uncharacterized protein LOC116437998 isoform X9 [Corvus moneduloides]|uniref:uncharacterized protein LOC116437998 isoform X9 n=1 Tax=Corvus moneduloides TaxID=1196302 RepID=UPI0013630F84|nr:uncharacterized protein LOC116437998 isoform X9 [Corvus moneduloides]